MHLNDLLTPLASLVAVLTLLVFVERWIHSHLYGVGWLLTNDEKSATAIYYVLLFPGVFLHEFVQYMLAGALNVKIKRMIAWPEAQENGTLRLDFVQIQEARWFQAAIIGAAPMIMGMGLVWLISDRVLGLEAFLKALETADITIIGPAFQNLASKPDFYLWLYLVFTISNAMLPTPADRQGWPLVFAIFTGVILFLVITGSGDVLWDAFTGPVAHGIERLATALAAVLVVECMGILFIGFFEEVLERFTKRKFLYTPPRGAREPGSSLPLPPGAPPPSIYNIPLPLPKPAQSVPMPSRAQSRPVSASTTGPAQQRPPFPASAGPSQQRPPASAPQPAASAFAQRSQPPHQQPPTPPPAARPPFTNAPPAVDQTQVRTSTQRVFSGRQDQAPRPSGQQPGQQPGQQSGWQQGSQSRQPPGGMERPAASPYQRPTTPPPPGTSQPDSPTRRIWQDDPWVNRSRPQPEPPDDGDDYDDDYDDDLDNDELDDDDISYVDFDDL